ncbi:MAG: cyclic pyranopterin monophosphate synthase MoaC [Litorivicinus sp.]
MNGFTHTDAAGNARMVDVSEKSITRRVAVAEGFLIARPDVIERIASHNIAKGDVLAVARVAGIMAAKRTPELIPLCHGLPMDGCEVELTCEDDRVRIQATCRIDAKTGIEMESLTAVSVAALTLYDMCKAVDKAMRIEGVRLLSKTGGKSGDYHADR